MSDPLIDDANAISNQSPKIRAFAQLSAQRTIAAEQREATLEKTVADLTVKVDALTPTPTPVPVPTPTGPNVFVIHYADSAPFAPPSKYDAEYALAVSSWGADPYLATLTRCKGCAYRTCVEINGVTQFQHSEGGISVADANTGGYALLDAAGKQLIGASGGALAGDVGSPAYQALWIVNVKAYLATMKVTHLFLDNVTGITYPGWFGTPAKYDTTAKWQAAYLSMLAVIRAAMPDIYIIANAANPLDPAWVAAVAKLVDAVLIEGYDGSATHNALIAAAKAAGADVYGNVLSDVAPWTKSAAMHKAFRAAGGDFFGVGSGGPDPYDLAWVNA